MAIWRRLTGIGRAGPRSWSAAVELGRRTLAHAPSARVQLRTPRGCGGYLLPRLARGRVEQFGLVLLDTKHRVLRTTVLAVGHVELDGGRAARRVPRGGGRRGGRVVVFHNHPSGDPSPSPDDVELTRRLVAAGVLMGIDVVDHIVLGDVRYCSFKEMGPTVSSGRTFDCFSGISGDMALGACSTPDCRSTS